eukprot:jgi/Chrzof1/11804/Cz06g10210.t1
MLQHGVQTVSWVLLPGIGCRQTFHAAHLCVCVVSLGWGGAVRTTISPPAPRTTWDLTHTVGPIRHRVTCNLYIKSAHAVMHNDVNSATLSN